MDDAIMVKGIGRQMATIYCGGGVEEVNRCTSTRLLTIQNYAGLVQFLCEMEKYIVFAKQTILISETTCSITNLEILCDTNTRQLLFIYSIDPPTPHPTLQVHTLLGLAFPDLDVFLEYEPCPHTPKFQPGQ
jgi:hypothetical protein